MALNWCSELLNVEKEQWLCDGWSINRTEMSTQQKPNNLLMCTLSLQMALVQVWRWAQFMVHSAAGTLHHHCPFPGTKSSLCKALSAKALVWLLSAWHLSLNSCSHPHPTPGWAHSWREKVINVRGCLSCYILESEFPEMTAAPAGKVTLRIEGKTTILQMTRSQRTGGSREFGPLDDQHG